MSCYYDTVVFGCFNYVVLNEFNTFKFKFKFWRSFRVARCHNNKLAKTNFRSTIPCKHAWNSILHCHGLALAIGVLGLVLEGTMQQGDVSIHSIHPPTHPPRRELALALAFVHLAQLISSPTRFKFTNQIQIHQTVSHTI